MNQSQKNGAATLMGIFVFMGSLVVVGLATAGVLFLISYLTFPQPAPATSTDTSLVQFAVTMCSYDISNWRQLMSNGLDESEVQQEARTDATLGEGSMGDLCNSVGINAIQVLFPTSTDAASGQIENDHEEGECPDGVYFDFQTGECDYPTPEIAPTSEEGFFSPAFFATASGTPCETIGGTGLLTINGLHGEGKVWTCTLPDPTYSMYTFTNNGGANVTIENGKVTTILKPGEAVKIQYVTSTLFSNGSTEWQCTNPSCIDAFCSPEEENIYITTTGTSTPDMQGYKYCTQVL